MDNQTSSSRPWDLTLVLIVSYLLLFGSLGVIGISILGFLAGNFSHGIILVFSFGAYAFLVALGLRTFKRWVVPVYFAISIALLAGRSVTGGISSGLFEFILTAFVSVLIFLYFLARAKYFDGRYFHPVFTTIAGVLLLGIIFVASKAFELISA